MKIIASNKFIKFKRKSTAKFQIKLDQEVKSIIKNPLLGIMKKGNLKNIRVHKFKFDNQLYLLSYEQINKDLHLHIVGSHENYYKKLKQMLDR